MTDEPSEEHQVFVSALPAGRDEHRVALAVVLVSTVVFLAAAPFAQIPLAPLPAFIPIYESALVVNDLITAVFLFGQFNISRSRALLLLACGYLFTAFVAVSHALTFPGLFSPTGLLDAGPQSTAWLYMFWHGGFPLLVIAYTRCKDGGRKKPLLPGRAEVVIMFSVGAVLGAVVGLTLLATAGHDFLPAIMQGNYYTPAIILAVSSIWLLSLLALLLLAQRRPYSVLDLWLMVVMCAWLFDIALSAVLNAGRYDLGFYAGRIYGLLATTFVLIVLLLDNSRLYAQLIELHASDRKKAAELQRLTVVDPLTGIANRRAFEQALDQEWRRTMRHNTPLCPAHDRRGLFQTVQRRVWPCRW
jgi:Membrane-associated sensor, integral membrane domain